MSEPDIDVSECYVRLLAPVDKIFFETEPVCNILYRRFIGYEYVFILSYSPFQPCTHCVNTVLNLFDTWGDLYSPESEYYSFIIPIPDEDFDQFWSTAHVDKLG